ncbi:MAG: HD domain-containing protein, partial [Endomicrobiales bacterium]
EKEGPPVAGRILTEMDYEESNVYEVCAIIAHHHTPGPYESVNFKVVYDADWLVNLQDEVDVKDKTRLKKAIEKIFLTEPGRRLAEKLYLS